MRLFLGNYARAKVKIEGRFLYFHADKVEKISLISGSVPTRLARFPLCREASLLGWGGFRKSGKRPYLVGEVSAVRGKVSTWLGSYNRGKLRFYLRLFVISSLTF